MSKIEELFKELQRAKSKQERFIEVEHDLRYMFISLETEPTLEDWVALDDVKQSIMTIFMQDLIDDKSYKTFLCNCKQIIYSNLKKLKEHHPDICIDKTILFMEDYYFNNID